MCIRNNDERSLLIGGREFSCSWHYYLIGVFDLTNAEQYLQGVISNLFRQNTLIAMIGLTTAQIGILGTFPLFWPMPTAVLAGTAAAAGTAWINSVGNLAGFFGPSIVGVITDLTKRSDYGLYVASAMLLVGSALVLAFVPKRYQVDLG